MSDYGSTPPPPPPPPPNGGYGPGGYGPGGYGAGGYGAPGTPPPNYLVWAILSVLLCWPVSIAAIVFSTQVNSKWARGDVAGAQDASKKAKTFAMVATILGGIGIVLAVILNVVGAGLMATSSSGS